MVPVELAGLSIFNVADVAAERHGLGGGAAELERRARADVELTVAGDRSVERKQLARRGDGAVVDDRLADRAVAGERGTGSDGEAPRGRIDDAAALQQNAAGRGDGKPTGHVEGAGNRHVAGVGQRASDAELGGSPNADCAGVGGTADHAEIGWRPGAAGEIDEAGICKRAGLDEPAGLLFQVAGIAQAALHDERSGRAIRAGGNCQCSTSIVDECAGTELGLGAQVAVPDSDLIGIVERATDAEAARADGGVGGIDLQRAGIGEITSRAHRGSVEQAERAREVREPGERAIAVEVVAVRHDRGAAVQCERAASGNGGDAAFRKLEQRIARERDRARDGGLRRADHVEDRARIRAAGQCQRALLVEPTDGDRGRGSQSAVADAERAAFGQRAGNRDDAAAATIAAVEVERADVAQAAA